MFLSVENVEVIKKKMTAEAKNIRTGKKRDFFLTSFMNGQETISFLSKSHENFNQKFKEENQRSWNYINDKENAEKFGFYNEKDFREGGKYYVIGSKNQLPNQSPEQILAWAEKAMPKIEEDRWAFEFELDYFNQTLKNMGLEQIVLETKQEGKKK